MKIWVICAGLGAMLWGGAVVFAYAHWHLHRPLATLDKVLECVVIGMIFFALSWWIHHKDPEWRT